MQILNGKKIADNVLDELSRRIKKRRLKLKLAAVLVAKNPASLSFVGRKKQACEKVGVDFALYRFSINISQKILEKQVRKIAKNLAISGIIIQLPLPKSIDTDSILNLVPLEKDVDCLGRNYQNEFEVGKIKILPPVVGAIKKIFQAYKIKTQGKKVLIIGKGRLVGQPLITWLSKTAERAEETGFPSFLRVLVADKATRDLARLCQQADIIISGVGKPGLIRGEMIKKGAVIIDVGSSKKAGKGGSRANASLPPKIVGDVDFESCAKKAGAISPVPGGVGPLTVACLLENLVKLKER